MLLTVLIYQNIHPSYVCLQFLFFLLALRVKEDETTEFHLLSHLYPALLNSVSRWCTAAEGNGFWLAYASSDHDEFDSKTHLLFLLVPPPSLIGIPNSLPNITSFPSSPPSFLLLGEKNLLVMGREVHIPSSYPPSIWYPDASNSRDGWSLTGRGNSVIKAGCKLLLGVPR